MTALRRMKVGNLGGMAAALALALATPAVAQNADAPIDVTAAPPPSAETIGPSQLRDFNLQGTVTRPADRPATAPADTATAQPRSGEAVPAEAAAPSAGPSGALASRQRSIGTESSSPSPAGITGAEPPITPSLPLEVTTNPAPQPDLVDPSRTVVPADAGDGLLSWPWIAALIALIGGGAFLARNLRSRSRRHGDPGRMAFAGLVPGDVEVGAEPPLRPRADPVPPRGHVGGGPRPDPVPPAGTARPSTPPKPPSDGTIVSTKLKPQLNVEFIPDRVVVTEQEVMLMFEIVISNVGSAPARDVLVEGHLFTAHIGQDRDIATFFQNPTASDDRMTLIAPLGRVSLKSVARLPIDQVNQFEAGGRKLFVPLIGFNILYRFGGSEGQASASFLVGRGNEEDEKLAPFRIDQGPKIFRGLSSRAHSIGMQTA